MNFPWNVFLKYGNTSLCVYFNKWFCIKQFIFSRTPEEHLKHIEIIFQKLKVAGLKLKEAKCDFFKSEIHYLGHLISGKGIQPLPEKLDTIRKHASSSDTQRNKTISWFNRLLSKIHPTLLRNLQTSSRADSKRHAVWMDSTMSVFIWNAKRCINVSTYSQVSRYWEALYNFLQMQANMGGLVYSLKNTHL